jgi:hypothetical protein
MAYGRYKWLDLLGIKKLWLNKYLSISQDLVKLSIPRKRVDSWEKMDLLKRMNFQKHIILEQTRITKDSTILANSSNRRVLMGIEQK